MRIDLHTNSDLVLAGKRILVTGGSLGIGRACAEACLKVGARVMICARTREPLEKAIDDFHAKGYREVSGAIADVTRQEEIDAVLTAIVHTYGGLDGVVHCAGIQGPIGPVTDVEPSEWMETVRVNLFGAFLVARQACQLMRASGGGRIVLFSGGGAACPRPNYSAYACSKVGVVRLAETLAREAQPYNIEINCLAPGFVLTRMHEATLRAGEKAGKDALERTMREMESGGVPPHVPAQAVVFLLSERANGITGKFVAAPYDRWDEWPEHLDQLGTSDIFTLRRIVPKDRGLEWQ